jgi:hypothetical protein
MNQANTGPRQDAAKRRRDYLRKKFRAYVHALLAAGVCMACIGYLCSPAGVYVAGIDDIPDPSRFQYLGSTIYNSYLVAGHAWFSYCCIHVLILVSLLLAVVVSIVCCWRLLAAANRIVMEDMAKSRSEYFWTKAEISTLAVVCGLFCIFGMTLFVLGTYQAFLGWHPYSGYAKKDHDIFDTTYPDHVLGSMPEVIGFLIVGITGFAGARSRVRKAKALPYVPPVHKQIAALPAEEILVRGSDQPAALPEELLRAAHEGVVESAAELLRAESRTK